MTGTQIGENGRNPHGLLSFGQACGKAHFRIRLAKENPGHKYKKGQRVNKVSYKGRVS